MASPLFSSGNVFSKTLLAAAAVGLAAGALAITLPHANDFESDTPGPVVTSVDTLVYGDVEVVETLDTGSTQALLLLQGTPPGSVSYAVTGAGAGVHYLDFGIRPAATSSDEPFVTLDGAEAAFVTTSPGKARLRVFDAASGSSGAWVSVGPELDTASGLATDFLRVTVRVDYVANRFDLALNDAVVGLNFTRRASSSAAPATLAFYSRGVADTLVDDLSLGSALPPDLPEDWDGDGIADAWEITHGLNPHSSSDAGLDPDADGLTNLQEFLAGTAPDSPDYGTAGYVTDRIWPGTYQSAFFSDPRPVEAMLLSTAVRTATPVATLSAGSSSPWNAAPFSVRELAAYVSPATTGDYTLALASDDAGVLYVSEDATPEKLHRIAKTPTSTGYGSFATYPEQRSGTIRLEAGKRYLVRAFSFDFGGDDFIRLGWTVPGSSTIVPVPAGNVASAPALSLYTPDGSRLAFADDDDDGLNNLREHELGTDPANADTDGDGIPDGWEIAHMLNPLSSADAAVDNDGDGLNNLQEFLAGTDPGTPDYGTAGYVTDRVWGGTYQSSLAGVPDPVEAMLLSSAVRVTTPSAALSAGANSRWDIAPLSVREVAAYVLPATTGDYTLALASDDVGVLYVSEDDTPEKLRRVAVAETSTPYGAFTVYPAQRSGTMHLEAGKRYLVRAFSFDFGGDDFLRLGWTTPGSSTIVPIPATNVASAPSLSLYTPDGVRLAFADDDGDGLNNLLEYELGTDPANADSDGDGMPDGWEIAHGLNPLSSADAAPDADGDGLTNLQEFLVGTDLYLVDSDGDGLNDGDEITHGKNPLVAELDAPLVKIAGQKVWLRADHATPDVDGLVSSWSDDSGSGNAAVNSGSARPLLVGGALHGNPVLRFNGTNQFLYMPDFISAATAGEAFVVMKSTETGGSLRGLWRMGGTASAGLRSFYPQSDGRVLETFGIRDGWVITRGTTDIHAPHLYSASVGSDRITLSQNGVAAVTQALGAGNIAFATNPLLGHNGAELFKGDIAEVIVYNRVLTDAEREAVNRYLIVKYTLVPAPDVPSSVTAAHTGAHQALVSWTAAQLGGVKFRVERRPAGGVFAAVATVDAALSCLDTGLEPGVAYEYRVTAVNLAGSSAGSAVFSLAASEDAVISDLATAGMRYWLRADAVVADADGGVRSWKDLSGHSAVSSAGPDTRPSLAQDPTAFGGRPVVRFNGTNQFLYMPDFMSGATAGEAFVVMKSSETGGSLRGLWRMGGTASAGLRSFYPQSDGRVLETFGIRDGWVITPGTTDMHAPHLYSAAVGSNRITLRQNDVTAVTQALAPGNIAFTTSPLLGHNGAEVFKGDIAEVIVYDRILTNAEREAVNRYLNRKYALVAEPAFLEYADRNGDGIADGYGLTIGIDPDNADHDGDGVSNADELRLGTNPFAADTDGDGMPDNLDAFPLDPSRSSAPAGDPDDHTAPGLTLVTPSTATPIIP